jgi:uncharacterized membrane protein (UPF0127 family)
MNFRVLTNEAQRRRRRIKNPLLRGSSRIIFFLLFVPILSCGAAGKDGKIKFEKSELSIQTAVSGTVRMEIELARTDKQHAQGLMNRKKLDDGKGMLFVFDRDQIMSFWMKNTIIPLSIAFIASDGRILEIYDMKPLDTSIVRSVRYARYALETPQGWFSRAGITSGDVVQIPENW